MRGTTKTAFFSKVICTSCGIRFMIGVSQKMSYMTSLYLKFNPTCGILDIKIKFKQPNSAAL